MNNHSTVPVRQPVFWICLALAVMVWFVFMPSLSFDFVNYDDPQYVYDNPAVSAGVTLPGLRQILTHPHSANWHPLTSLTHMLDCSLYGLNPAGHRLTNILLHLAVVVSLFLVLRSATGSLWRSACTAALFAVHPLRVESVVWVSERKDVLSGLFFVLTLGAYFRYARRSFAVSRYLPVMLLFALGLLSKSMLVTLPFVLLLLDYWPLRRPLTAKLIAEKIPLMLLSAVFCGVTIWAQGKAVVEIAALPVPWRLENALLSYVIYMKQLFLPTGLAVLYPALGETIPLWKTSLSLILLTGITIVVLRGAAKRPYLVTGWFWYLGMLAPVIGILQVGGQAHADRYTYLPQIGLAILLVWLAAERVITARRRVLIRVAAPVLLAGLMLAARIQVGYWSDSISLWSRTLDCTEKNFTAHSNLGTVLFVKGQTAEAIDHFEQALRINSGKAEVFNNLAVAYAEQGRYPEAAAVARRALELSALQCTPPVTEAIRQRLAEYQSHLSQEAAP